MQTNVTERILVIGSGLSGMSAAVSCAEKGMQVLLVSPLASERSQSVMAAGGINAAVDTLGEGDSPAQHESDTYLAGCCLEDRADIAEMCRRAPALLHRLEEIGVVFTRQPNGAVDLRSFGGQSKKRTAFAGAATGKLLVTAMTAKCREYECKGLITRRLGCWFYEALIADGSCYGALIYDENTGKIESVYARDVVMATGGQNLLFGKTTGSMLCNGYAAGKLFAQGVLLRNLEFIQYHPTTVETSHKRMLITEAARGEGGRLFYEQDGRRVYFMEDKYGPRGNLMTRDIVSRCIAEIPGQVYLDISFLGEDVIRRRLGEVAALCETYLGLDVTKEPIPVGPSVHFFMGGIRVDRYHRTNIRHLYAVGECASKYHGANRLGGNSLLAALYSGMRVAEAVCNAPAPADIPDFSAQEAAAKDIIYRQKSSESPYPAKFVYRELAKIMNEDLGIVRTGEKLRSGLENIRFYREAVRKLSFDPDVSVTEGYSLGAMLLLSEAILQSALAREESRGAHFRSDFPETSTSFNRPSAACYDAGTDTVRVTFRPDGTEE